MIAVHWNIIVFAIIILAGDYGIDVMTPLILLALAAFTLIWGGIFWW